MQLCSVVLCVLMKLVKPPWSEKGAILNKHIIIWHRQPWTSKRRIHVLVSGVSTTLTRWAMRSGDRNTIHWSTAMVSWPSSFWMETWPPKKSREKGDTSVQSYRKIWAAGEVRRGQRRTGTSRHGTRPRHTDNTPILHYILLSRSYNDTSQNMS